MVKANGAEQRRNDPEIRAVIEETLSESRDAIRKAQQLLDEAAKVLSSVKYMEDSPLYQRVVSQVHSASAITRRESQFLLAEPTSTYVGNMAVFKMGDKIAQELNK